MAKYSKIYIACKKLVKQKLDKKIIAGIAIGISLAIGSSVLAQTNENEGIWSSLTNWFGQKTGFSQSTPSISAINKELTLEAEKCAKGEQGTLGFAIKNAMKIHQEIAVIAPPVEELFDSDCLSGLMNIFDLSFAIPSLASIMGTVLNAVKQFAQQKVCRALTNAGSMIAAPINKGLGNISTLMAQGSLNGMINGIVNESLAGISLDLGQDYLSPAPSNTQINVNPFGLNQTQFDSSINSNNPNNLNLVNNTANINHSLNIINQNQQQIAANTKALITLNPQLAQANQRLANCQNNQQGDCSQISHQAQNLNNQVNSLNTQINQLNNNLNQYSSNNYPINSTQIESQSTVNSNQGQIAIDSAASASNNKSAQTTGIWSSLSNYFK